MPTEHCGCTDNKADYYDLFPHWATEDMISESIREGLSQVVVEPEEPPRLVKPDHWPECAEASRECEFGTFNELACECFSEVFCMLWCGEEMTLDPTAGCTCITNDEYLAYFPEWATPKDIDFSQQLLY